MQYSVMTTNSREMRTMQNYRMELTRDERDILAGGRGPAMQKVLKSVVLYGEAFGARRLLPVEGPVHVVTSMGMSGLDAMFNMMDELIDAGLKTLLPFTADPRPIDYDNVPCTQEQKDVFSGLFGSQDRYEAQLRKLGLKSDSAFSCTSYLPEVGNTPHKGQILSWAESSAVVFVNSVLGARSNRNSGVLELFCGIVGKTPEFGLLTDEGRRARWVIEVKTSGLPAAHLLGSVIGKKVMEDVPYIVGLDKLLGAAIDDRVRDYLKDMGAATASSGSVGLYHVENLTPEAVEQGRALLRDDYQTYCIDDAALNSARASHPILWKRKEAVPEFCFIGCPQLSLSQIYYWKDLIQGGLRKAGKDKVAIRTILCAAPDVLEKFKTDGRAHAELRDSGVNLTYLCPVMYMNNAKCAEQPIITNSTKMRTYSTARYFEDLQVLETIVNGTI